MEQKQLKNRSEIDDKYKIDLSSMYKNEDLWREDVSNIRKNIEDVKKYEGRVLESAETLLNGLDDYYNVDSRLEKIYVYANVKFTTDIGDSNFQTLLETAKELFHIFSINTSYLVPEILETDYSNIENMYNEKPELKKYETILKRLFRNKKHILSKEEEKLFSQFDNIASKFDSCSDFLRDQIMDFGIIEDEDGNEIKVSSQNEHVLLKDKSRKIRKATYENVNKVYKQFNNALADNYIGNVKFTSMYAKCHDYKDTISQDLEELNLPSNLLNTLIEVTNKNLDIYKKYFNIIKKVLDVDKLEAYDVSAPVVSSEKEYTFEEAKEIILDTLKIYGDEYYDILKKIFENNWIDVYSSNNKSTGWYETSSYLANSFVFANYNSKYYDVSALTHELGHAVHEMLSIKYNSYHLYQEPLFLAEVASLTNEMVLGKSLLNKLDNKNDKLEILNMMIKIFSSNYFNAIQGSEFELKVHQMVENGENVTADVLNNCWLEICNKYTGDVVEGNSSYSWSKIPHFFVDFYYYKYSVGVAIAMYLSDKILYGTEQDKENYLSFLKLGGSLEPVDALKVAGVDINNSIVFEKAILSYNELLDQFVELYEK